MHCLEPPLWRSGPLHVLAENCLRRQLQLIPSALRGRVSTCLVFTWRFVSGFSGLLCLPPAGSRLHHFWGFLVVGGRAWFGSLSAGRQKRSGLTNLTLFPRCFVAMSNLSNLAVCRTFSHCHKKSRMRSKLSLFAEVEHEVKRGSSGTTIGPRTYNAQTTRRTALRSIPCGVETSAHDRI